MDIREEHQLETLQEALLASFIGPGDLWYAYFRLGGLAGDMEIEAHLHGLLGLPPRERDLLAAAVNGLIDAILPLPRATLSTGSEATPSTGAPPPPG